MRIYLGSPKLRLHSVLLSNCLRASTNQNIWLQQVFSALHVTMNILTSPSYNEYFKSLLVLIQTLLV